ncbi:copper ion binding protein [Rhynchospora pubera]|uniref:Copper ion binding protein n=1 Tax=Rhynchospora pubera TaxID=906938 RepID=A0AAV8F0W6_9POAL|nr:copper ion binding protein [Rhynchospora pubera]
MIRQSLITSLKSLSETQPQALNLTRSVSGTAKGKAKLKAGQVLKRATLTKKKQGSDDSSAPHGARGDKETVDRLTSMATSCLTAPTPIRYLSAKEREREAEREKLGLFSKERQRELDMIKAQKKASKEGKKEEENKRVPLGSPGFDYISLGLVDEEAIPKYELTVEDGRRLAKEYSRVLMRKHRARQKAETDFLNLKKEAINALPEKLREAALVPDFTPFPTNQFMATLTPPIEGYAEKVREAAAKHTANEKLQ